MSMYMYKFIYSIISIEKNVRLRGLYIEWFLFTNSLTEKKLTKKQYKTKGLITKKTYKMFIINSKILLSKQIKKII